MRIRLLSVGRRDRSVGRAGRRPTLPLPPRSFPRAVDGVSSEVEAGELFAPIRHFITPVFRTFSHRRASAWAGHDVLIIVIWGAVAAAVALRRFEWAPQRT
jgi:hypothetical protein